MPMVYAHGLLCMYSGHAPVMSQLCPSYALVMLWLFPGYTSVLRRLFMYLTHDRIKQKKIICLKSPFPTFRTLLEAPGQKFHKKICL